MKDNDIFKEIHAVRGWISHPDVGERLRDADLSAMIIIRDKYGDCHIAGHSTPMALEDMIKRLIQSGLDTLDAENACTLVSGIVDYISSFFDFEEDDEETCEV